MTTPYTDRPMEDRAEFERREGEALARIIALREDMLGAALASIAGEPDAWQAAGDRFFGALESLPIRDLALMFVVVEWPPILAMAQEMFDALTDDQPATAELDILPTHECADPWLCDRLERGAAQEHRPAAKKIRGVCSWCGGRLPSGGIE